VAKSFKDVMTYELVIDKCTGILPGSDCTNQLGILGIPGKMIDKIKNSIIYSTFFKVPFAGPVT
jgi:hypothetical protein